MAALEAALPFIDTCTRVFWGIMHLIGFLYIRACWKTERRRFYLLFAASWGLMALRSFAFITLNKNIFVHLLGSIVISPASSLIGLFAFYRLHKYVKSKVTTISRDDDGNYIARKFTEDDIDTIRPSRH